jgi:hypothetical protein
MESNDPAETLLGCIGAADQNLKVSLLNVPDLFSLFNRLDEHVFSLSCHLSKIKFDANDPAYVILNLLALAQRQMRNGFISFLRRQGYDGQLLFRVGVEATVFAYRIYEHPELGLVWVNKDTDRKAFRKGFEQADFPESMPYRENFEKYLDYLNEYRSHASLVHFAGTLKRQGDRLDLNYFDDNDLWTRTLFAHVSMSIRVAVVFRKMVERTAKVFVTSTEPEFEGIRQDFRKLTVKYRAMLGDSEQLAAVG